MRAGARHLFVIALAAVLAGCGSGDKAPQSNAVPGASAGEKPIVFFSQANSADPWRQVFDAETKAAAETHGADFTFEMATAGDDPNKQIDQIETAMVKKPKVLLVSPATEAVKDTIAKAHAAGTSVVLLDRAVPGEDWDVYVGGDNFQIGRAAGDYVAKRLNGKGVVLMIKGIADATATKERGSGFMDVMSKNPGIKVIEGDDCGYQRQKAQTYMENFLQRNEAFDAVFAHNDEMAIGAYQAMQSAHTPKKVVVGIDCCQMEVINMIKDGKLDATFSYPDPGPKGVEIALDFLRGNKPAARKVVLQTAMVTKENAAEYASQHPNLAK